MNKMKTQEQQDEQIFLWGMMAAMFCWGMSWASGKVLSSYGTSESIGFYRFLVTFLSLVIILPLIKEKYTISLKGIWVLLAASICMSFYNYFFLQGLKEGMPGAGGVLVTTLNPIITYAITLIIALRRPTRQEFLGLFIGLIAGCFLLKIWERWDNLIDAGNIYFILATVTWSVLSRFTAVSKNYGSSLSFSFLMYGICTVVMFCFSSSEESIRIVQQGDTAFWLNLFFSATITTAIATTYFFYATTRIGVDKASSYIFLVPLSAALGSWIFIGEIPQWNTIAGGMIGIVAVYVLNKKG